MTEKMRILTETSFTATFLILKNCIDAENPWRIDTIIKGESNKKFDKKIEERLERI